jgi:hypothetical protein
MNTTPETIGYVIGGSLKEGLFARLTVSSDQVQEGAFVVVEHNNVNYYGLVVDIRLTASDPQFAQEMNENRLPQAMAGILNQHTLFTELEIMPVLMQNIGSGDTLTDEQESKPVNTHPLPVKMLPPHHSFVRQATSFDVKEVFNPREEDAFVIGSTREQGHPIHLDLAKLTKRSSGIFGATGTGKSYLTRMILAGIINNNKSAVLLFDMHDEYAFGDTSSDTGKSVPGLKNKFGQRVKVCALGSSTTIQGNQPDFNLVFEYSDITTADIEMLMRELNLRETTPTTLAALENSFKQNWFETFKNMNEFGDDDERSVAYWAKNTGVNQMAAEGLHQKLKKLFQKDYLVSRTAKNPVNEIIDALKNKRSVILSFAKYETDLDYLMVTNLLTRKIRQEWEQMTTNYNRNKSNPGSKDAVEPVPLVIALEEAHKLLNREMADQTAFSIIAREMRKYYVTLLIIDQRPSKIYDEVMSQLGTRICGWLGDENDISAVLSGLSGRDSLRGMLARLQPTEEVLMVGFGVPMPIPIRSRRYDEKFWKELLKKKELSKEEQQKSANILFGED